FFVDTGQGSLQALGTRFSVRFSDSSVRVAVFEGAVEIRPARAVQAFVLPAGQRTVFTASVVEPAQAAAGEAELWQSGMFLARQMPL
ncbi:FecR domain-containing protein, partial [Acinetobacter baumannii]